MLVWHIWSMLLSCSTLRSSWTDERWQSLAAWLWWMREPGMETGSTSASLVSEEVRCCLQHFRPVIVKYKRFTNMRWHRDMRTEEHTVLITVCMDRILQWSADSVLTTVFSPCFSLKVIWVLDTSSQRSESARCGFPLLVSDRFII